MKFKELNIAKTFDKTSKILLAVIGGVFLLSFVFYCASFPGKRFTFRFQSVDSGKNSVEWRLLPHKKGSEKVSLYVDELLLGPKTERERPLFSPGTKAEFCFSRGKTLYVNLSNDLLYKTGNASDIMYGIELFRENIMHEFPEYHSVEIYIDNQPLFEGGLIK